MARRTPGSFIVARYIISRHPKASISMRPADAKLDRVAHRAFPRGSGEQFKGVAGHGAIVPGALYGVLERAMLPHCRQRKLEIAVDDLAFFQCPAPKFALLRSSAPERQNDGQGDLSLAEIIADILAELGRRAAVVERVVYELKGDAEIGAVTLAGGDLRLGPAGENGPDLAGRGEQGRGLGADNGEIGVLGRLRVLGG